MSEDNIWKRQAQMNRMKAEGKTDPSSPSNNSNSSINAFIKNNNNSSPAPPWAKNNAQNTTSSQPSWIKNQPNSLVNTQPPPSTITKPKSPPKMTTTIQNEVNNQPPWAKNNAPSQPSWAKNTTGGQSNSSQSNQPPWMKNNPNTATQPSWARKNEGTSNQPSWMKNTEQKPQSPRQAQINQVPWAKNNSNSPRSSGQQSPSWMRDRAVKNENSKVNDSNWKMQQSFEIQKKKQQLQEEIRKQEEEEKERRRVQKEKREKEEQEKNMMRELEIMVQQDELSLAREKKDKEEEKRKRCQQQQQQRRLRQEEELRKESQRKRIEEEEKKKIEEEQKKKLQEERLRAEAEQNERKQKERLAELDRTSRSQQEKGRKGVQSRKKKKELMQNSKISHISSIKGVDNINIANDPDVSQSDNIYHKYLRLINQETMESDYKKKIELQKCLYQLQLQSKKQCQSEIISLFQNKKVTNRKRKFIFSNSMQIQYALCEGRKGESGLQFEEEEVNQLKTRFLQYELLTKCVMSLMKKKINVHLRVPIMNYAEFKGVSFLVEHVCQELIDIIEIEIGLFQEISNEVLVFQKELELSVEEQTDFKAINKDQLMVKKITIESEDFYILYLKAQNKPNKAKQANSPKIVSKMLPKYSHLNDISILQYIIGQNTLLPYLQTQIEVTKEVYEQLSKVSSPALISILKTFRLARAINTVYSSCQGEVEEESFFQLILEGNKQIWDMIVAAGSPDRDIPQAIVLAVLEKLSSVGFNFSSKMYTSKKKELVKHVKPSVFIQRYDYELLEFIKNIEKYIAEDKQELVEQSMTLSRQLWEDIQEGQKMQPFNFLKLKNEVSYLLYKQKDVQAISMVEKALEEVGRLTLKCVPLYLMAIKIYVAKDMQVSMLKALSELLPTLQFYFGEESMLHALVYTAVGIYYSKKTEQSLQARTQKVVTFYEHSFKIILKLYGEKSQEIADIYLSRGSAFLNLGKYDFFSKDIQNALRIYKTHSKSGPKIAECNHLMGRVKCLEGDIIGGIELMEQSSNQYMKMYNHIESLYILFEILPFLEDKQPELEPKIEKIVEICFTYKSIWAFKKISTLILDRELNCYTSLSIRNLQELYHPLDEDDRTNEEVLVDLEEEIKGFTSFIEIVRWALSIIAGKLAARREVTGDYQKAHSIIREVFHFYGKNQSISMDLKDSQLL